MLLTHADDLLYQQLHTVVSPYTVHASNPCWWLAVLSAAHCSVSIHSTCFWPTLVTYCINSCTQQVLDFFSHFSWFYLTPHLLAHILHKIRSCTVDHWDMNSPILKPRWNWNELVSGEREMPLGMIVWARNICWNGNVEVCSLSFCDHIVVCVLVLISCHH